MRPRWPLVPPPRDDPELRLRPRARAGSAANCLVDIMVYNRQAGLVSWTLMDIWLSVSVDYVFGMHLA